MREQEQRGGDLISNVAVRRVLEDVDERIEGLAPLDWAIEVEIVAGIRDLDDAHISSAICHLLGVVDV